LVRSQTSWKRFALALAAAGVVVAIALVVVAIAVGSRLQFDRIENRSLADGSIQIQVAEARGTTSTGTDRNVFVVGSGLVFEAERTYAGVLYSSDDCSTGAVSVGPWLPENSQLRTLRGNAPPGSGLDSYGSVGVTVGEPPQLVGCATLEG
jgi:hypothetical protein